jgi:branched-chain amino acid transport system substrate-binding protein
MKVEPGTLTSYKRGATDFRARMKADNCDLVVLGTVIRETIGAMTEAKKIGWTVDFLGAIPTNVLEVPALGKDVVEGLTLPGSSCFRMRTRRPARSRTGW